MTLQTMGADPLRSHEKTKLEELKMKLGYYNPQLKFAQIKKDGKVAGTLLLIHKAYGYNVQLHYFNVPGYSIDRYFSTQEKAEAFFDKTLSEASEK